MNSLSAKETLPEGYIEAEKIDLVRNKKQMLLVNALAIVLALGMLGFGMLIAPEGHAAFFDLKNHASAAVFKGLALCLGSIVYLIGHEAVHGVFMWHYSHRKPHFGLSFAYAYAGSDAYFAKGAYLVIALAPVTLWTLLLVLIQLLLPPDWFWVVWLIQISNISGAAGDLFVSLHLRKAPSTVLVQDDGTSMKVFLPGK